MEDEIKIERDHIRDSECSRPLLTHHIKEEPRDEKHALESCNLEHSYVVNCAKMNTQIINQFAISPFFNAEENLTETSSGEK